MSFVTPKNGNKSKKRTESESSRSSYEASSKKRKMDDSSDEEGDMFDDGNESKVLLEGGLEPNIIAAHFKSFFAFAEKSSHKSNVTGNSLFGSIFKEWIAERKKDAVIDDEAMLQKAMKSVATRSLAFKHISGDLLISAVQHYLSRGERVEDFENFPKLRFSNKLSAYTHHKKMKIGVAQVGDVWQKIREDKKGSDAAEKLMKEDMEAYLNELERFIEDMSDVLSEAQIDYVNKKISNAHKKLNPPEPKTPRVPKTPKVKKEPRSAFQIYMSTYPDLYAEMDEEKREKKLLKKFNKLSETERDIFERLAVNEQ